MQQVWLVKGLSHLFKNSTKSRHCACSDRKFDENNFWHLAGIGKKNSILNYFFRQMSMTQLDFRQEKFVKKQSPRRDALSKSKPPNHSTAVSHNSQDRQERSLCYIVFLKKSWIYTGGLETWKLRGPSISRHKKGRKLISNAQDVAQILEKKKENEEENWNISADVTQEAILKRFFYQSLTIISWSPNTTFLLSPSSFLESCEVLRSHSGIAWRRAFSQTRMRCCSVPFCAVRQECFVCQNVNTFTLNMLLTL